MKYTSVDEYVSQLSSPNKEKIEELRTLILSINPCITEYISYNMPAYKCKKALFYYFIFKNHIGLYPTTRPIEVFKDELLKYKTSKGAIQIPFDQDIPLELVKKMIEFNLSTQ